MTSVTRTDLRLAFVVVLRTCDRSIRIAPNGFKGTLVDFVRSEPGLIRPHSSTCILIVYVPRSAGFLAIGIFVTFWLILGFVYIVGSLKVDTSADISLDV